ncbi:MAG: methyltransferase domain-containing protein [Pseudomonadota bacterium]
MFANQGPAISPAALIDEGNRAYRERRFDEAIERYQRALALEPNNAVALHNIGSVYFTVGETSAALPLLEKAFQLSREVEYARDLGKANLRARRFAEAAVNYRYVATHDPNDEAALSNYAACSFFAGERVSAAAVYAHLVCQRPGNLGYKLTFVRCLAELAIKLSGLLQQAYLACLQEPKVSCAAAADAWFATVNANPELSEALTKLSAASVEQCEALLERQDVVRALNDPFLYLGVEQLVHPAELLERAVANVRRAVLFAPRLSASLSPLLRAMAVHFFHTEYAAWETSAETQRVEQLVEQCNRAAPTDLRVRDMLVIACYRPLHLLAPLRNAHQQFVDDESIGKLVRLGISNRLTEQALAREVASFSSITNRVSRATRAQYEESPYPRWQLAHALPPSEEAVQRTRGLEVLNAGCGTGHEVITAAQTLRAARFTAIDLSRTSIAYGMRQASDIGINNITFLQGDILEVDKLDKQFDVILSAGVLHHMEDPQIGLNRLAGVLKRQGGRMLVALYSKIARERILGEVHRYIQEKGYAANEADIRQFRQDVLRSEAGHFLRNAQRFREFTSLCECRDMLFHVQEHLHTWLEVARRIDNAGLRVVSLPVQPELKQRYVRMFPGDPQATNLANWHTFELRNPEAFKGMYYLWVAHREDQATAQTSSAVWAVDEGFL